MRLGAGREALLDLARGMARQALLDSVAGAVMHKQWNEKIDENSPLTEANRRRASNATGTGAWIVVEAGVRLDQTGPYAVGTPWHDIQRGFYPIAVTNPIFINVTGLDYKHP